MKKISLLFILRMVNRYNIFTQIRKLFCCIFFLLPMNQFVVSQETKARQLSMVENDSVWCFHPFSVNIYAGVWNPIGRLNKNFKSSMKFGGSFSLMISKISRIEYGLGFSLNNSKNEVELVYEVDGQNLSTGKTHSGGVGVFYLHNIYKDYNFYVDLITGISMESILTDIVNPEFTSGNKNDSIVDFTTFGLSSGVDIWVNKFGIHNLGLRLLLTYAPYNRDKELLTNIGGFSLTCSFVYRFPKRDILNRVYYTKY